MSDREESAMGDERLVETMAREISAWRFSADPDGEPRHGYAHWDSGTGHPFFEGDTYVRHARKVAARLPAILRNAGYAIVPLEGEGFEARVQKAAEAIFAEFFGWTSDPGLSELASETAWAHANAALRAALSPGDDA
jgi:hypothetical protein